MKSIKCPQCNLVDWDTAEFCRRCCYSFLPPQQNNVDQANESQPNTQFEQNNFPNENENAQINDPYWDSPNVNNFQQHQTHQSDAFNARQNLGTSTTKPKIKMAVVSMIMGIMSFPMFWAIWVAALAFVLALLFGTMGAFFGVGVGFLVLILGLILGIVALVKKKKYPTQYGGQGFAITGIILSSIGILTMPMIAAIAIPNLLAARKSANEGSAISNIRTIADAEMTYMSNNGGRCGSLDDLGKAQLINSVLATGQNYGFQFTIIPNYSASGGCEIFATPTAKSVANRSFYFSTQEGVIRGADKNGAVAEKSDPPLETNLTPSRPQISSN